jgi:ribosomal-protein-alanine N-acetyltransferase
MGTFTVCRLQAEHLGGVARLEQLCFPHEPWSERSLRVLCEPGGIGMVALEPDGTVSAYVGMQYAAGEGSITNVATHPDYRRGGRAQAILTALLGAVAALCSDGVFLEVRPSNAPALALYARLGFEMVGRRKNFYRAPVEDALILRALPHVAAPQES